MTSFALPADLLPADGRFGAGPSKVRPAQLAAIERAGRDVIGTSHRKDGVKGLVGRVREGLAELFSLPEGYEIVLSLGGATAFWDAASFSLIERRATHLAFGEFSEKFATVTTKAPWLEEPAVVRAEPGSAPEIRHEPNTDAVAFPHNETSTGAALEPSRPATAGDGPDPLVLVDATSGAGGLPVDVAQTDAYYFSPQKCFGSDGGLWLAALSPAALERAERLEAERFVPAFLSLTTAIENSRKNQTYNTPAVATLVMLAEQIDWMLREGGLAAMAARTASNAEALYSWADKRERFSPFVAEERHRSRVVGTIDVDESLDAAAIAKTLRANGVLDCEPYRKLGRNQLRVGLFPNIDAADVEKLTAAIDAIVAAGVADR